MTATGHNTQGPVRPGIDHVLTVGEPKPGPPRAGLVTWYISARRSHTAQYAYRTYAYQRRTQPYTP